MTDIVLNPDVLGPQPTPEEQQARAIETAHYIALADYNGVRSIIGRAAVSREFYQTVVDDIRFATTIAISSWPEELGLSGGELGAFFMHSAEILGVLDPLSDVR